MRGDLEPKGYNEEQGRPIGKWGYLYHLVILLLILLASILLALGGVE